jgi:leader peptidase (prepilin peptidase)/N-methyltransferase
VSAHPLLGAGVGVAVGLVAAPLLAGLTVTAPDPAVRQWWRGAPASRRTRIQAAVSATGLGAVAGAAAGLSWLLPAFLALALVGAPLTVVDLRLHRLPNRLVAAAAVAGAGLLTLAAAASPEPDGWRRLLRSAEGSAAVYLVLFLLATVVQHGFGMGDVKLGGVLGGYLGWFGWGTVYVGILAGFVLGAAVSTVLLIFGRATMKTAIPFGPMLLTGPLIVLASGLGP